MAYKKSFLDDKTRILIIGCTSEPHEGNKAEFKKFFDKSVYFPFPDYTTRRKMWKQFITECGGQIKHGFPLSTLAHISHGYSAGSIKKAITQVLTQYRLKHQEGRPLTMSEFIGPLSLTHATMDDLYPEYIKFTDFITGDATRREKLEAALRGDDEGDGGKKKKKKKKGK